MAGMMRATGSVNRCDLTNITTSAVA